MNEEILTLDSSKYLEYFEYYKEEQMKKLNGVFDEKTDKQETNKKSIFDKLKTKLDEIFNKSKDFSVAVETVKQELENVTNNSEDDSVNVETVADENMNPENNSVIVKDEDVSDNEDSTVVAAIEENNNNNELDKMYYIKENLSKKKRKKIIRILSKYLDKDKKYKFIDMQDGLYKMYFLSKNGELIENIIDPFGTINGGEHPRIYKKAINPSGDTVIGFFDLTLDTNLSKMLVNSEDPFIDFDTGMSIPDNDAYSMTVDFSNTPQIDKFNKGVLLNNLNFAINAMANFGINIPKFRFFDLSDENHFTLISDFKVKTPLQYETIKVNGIDCPLGFNKYIDNGRIMTFNNGTVNTYYVNNPDNKLLLAQPFQQQPQQPIQQQQPQAQPQQPIQQQPQVQEINQTQLFNNIMNNGLGGGFNPFNAYPQQPITPNIITT